MNPVFEILPDYLEPQFTNLYCEVSEDSLTYFFQNDKDKTLTGLSAYELPDRFSNPDFTVKDIMDEKQVLRKNYNKVVISYSFSEFALIPYSMYSENEKSSIIDTLYGVGIERMTLTDNLPELEIHNYYTIPLYIHYYVISHFPLAKFNHQISYLLRQKQSDPTCIKVIFHQRKMVCMITVKGKLLLANSFFFMSAEDVVYHLLNICKQCKLDPTILLVIAGMIDRDSALALEIAKYFPNIKYATHQAELAENLRHFPPHYFSHMFSIT